jgi:hypothetical protein
MRRWKEPTLPLKMKQVPFLPALWLSLAASVCAQAATSYVQDFNAYPDGTVVLGDGSVIASSYGDAMVIGGSLRLTTDTFSDDLSNYIIPGLEGASIGWRATFKIGISSIGIPADGFAFGWGAGLGSSAEVIGSEEGWDAEVNHLFFSFDTFDNNGEGEGGWGLRAGGADGNQELLYAEVSGPLVGEGGSVAGEVDIRWDPVQGMSFRTTGFQTNIDVSGIATPGFTAADSNAFAFAARTGGATSTMDLDDVRIVTVPEPGGVSLGILSAVLATMHRRRKA